MAKALIASMIASNMSCGSRGSEKGLKNMPEIACMHLDFSWNNAMSPPSFAFFFASAIDKTSDRGFTSWLAEYSDDLIALGLRLKSASQYLNGLTSEDRKKALSQVRHVSEYEDPEINWEESFVKFLSEFGEDPDNPFMIAAMQYLWKNDEFREALLELKKAEAEERKG